MGGSNLTPVCHFTISALLEGLFPKAYSLGWGSVSLFHLCFTAVVTSGHEEGRALVLGKVVSFPSPGFGVGWSKVTPAVNNPCSSQWAITLKDQFSSFACNKVLQSLGIRGSKSHHVNYKSSCGYRSLDNMAWLPSHCLTAAKMLHKGNLHPG